MAKLKITPTIAIDSDELSWQFVRASGPGGQKVNKTSSAVQLRFDAAASPSLPDEVRARLIRIAGKRVNRVGVIVIDAQRFRSQERNRLDAMDRLFALIRRAAESPKPRKRTKPTALSRAKRLDAKRRRGALKRLRTTPRDTGG